MKKYFYQENNNNCFNCKISDNKMRTIIEKQLLNKNNFIILYEIFDNSPKLFQEEN